MHKKLMTACMAFTAFAAFVFAPTASAAQLTESGVTIKAGASITDTAGELKFTVGSSAFTCANADMSGVLTKDENGTIAAEIAAQNPSFTGTGSGGDCTSSGLGPVKPTVNSKLCLHIAKGTDIGTITGCAGAAVTFTLDVTNLGLECHYEKAEIGIEITTAPKDAEVKLLAGQVVKKEPSSSMLCPAEGELDLEFLLTTTDGTTLTFS